MLDISIVIPCFNGEPTLQRQLEALQKQQTAASFEVLVADNLSTDASAALIRGFQSRDSRFKYVEAFGRQGINHARNAGVQRSSAPLIALCDTDDVVSPGWVDAYLRSFAAGGALFGGPLRHIVDGQLAESQTAFVESPWIYSWPYGANCSFSREAYDTIGGFDETYRGGGDETDFFWRAQIAGFELGWTEDAWIDYYSRSSRRDVYRQKYAYGLSEVKLYKRFREYGMPRQSITRAPIAVAVAATMYALRPGDRRKNAARLGRNVGRIVGSVKNRTLYF